ncbi:MAG: hypothetical protein IKE77_09295 [Erysipelotrichaceae bacterium]|nr:hypothetical protein [Erysipelotrichaceae bacterium]
MEQIFSVIGQYAFPIVACVVMGWYVKYIQDNYRKDISDISIRHKDEMEKVTAALNNNTMAIQRLTDFIEKEDEKDTRY